MPWEKKTIGGSKVQPPGKKKANVTVNGERKRVRLEKKNHSREIKKKKQASSKNPSSLLPQLWGWVREQRGKKTFWKFGVGGPDEGSRQTPGKG